MKVYEKNFGFYNSLDINEIFIENSSGNYISLLNLGARINKFNILNNKKEYENIILDYENIDDLVKSREYYYGATIGRVGGRISSACFKLDGKSFMLDKNDRNNHLHGGIDGYDLRVWDYKVDISDRSCKVSFTLEDFEKSNYYPGNVYIKVSHIFDEDNRWTIEYDFKTDKKTIFNPTNHVYFNLNGNNKRNVLNHEIKVLSNKYVTVDKFGIPNDIRDVDGSVFDLREFKSLSDIVNSRDNQIIQNKGLDNPFILNSSSNQVIIKNPGNDRQVILSTDRPSVVIYSHGKLGRQIKSSGNEIKKYSGIALETQYLPNSINRDDFDDIIIYPNKVYKSKTTYSFKNHI